LAFVWIMTGQFGAPIHKADQAARELRGATVVERPTPVRVRNIIAEPHARELILFGKTEADRKVRLRARTDGRVDAVILEEGRSVAEGADILTFAMEDRQAKLAEAEAAEQRFRLAYEAGASLRRKSFRSRVALAENKADWEAAKARLKTARLDVDHTDIRSPFGGVVDQIDVEVGDFVKNGDTVATVVDLDPLVVSAQVAERDIPYLVRDGEAEIRLANGDARRGSVRYISRIGDESTRTFRVEAIVPNGDYSVAEGLTAEVRLKLGTVRAHLVSPAILTLSDDGAVGVKAVGVDNRVVFHLVEIVADTPQGVWLGGLPESVRLITVGQEFVREGQLVIPVPEGTIDRDKRDSPMGDKGAGIVAPKRTGDVG